MATGVAAATMTVVTIESTSCLSQCGKGPNVMVVDTSRRAVADNEDVVHRHQLYGVCDAVSAAAQLESLSIAVPSKLFAAVRVLEKAQTGTLGEIYIYIYIYIRAWSTVFVVFCVG